MPQRPPARVNSGSFRAGSPLPTVTPNRSILRRLSTQYHYQTFPTQPPKGAGRRRDSGSGSPDSYEEHPDQHDACTPLPIRQLALLALLSLAEQTALNSLSPYLPEMIGSFPGIDEDEVGLYTGLLASAFAVAQLLTNLIWGYLSDLIGRKPVLLTGTSLLCISFTIFGFCTRYWHVVLVHVAMGLLNGNAAVVPTCLGELTDRSNQSKAFTWLPVVYGLGGITGPALGGLLVRKIAADRFPFLAPNILSAVLLAFSVVVLALWFEETLDEQYDSHEPPAPFGWLRNLVARVRGNSKHFSVSRSSRDNETGYYDASEDDTIHEERNLLSPEDEDEGSNDPKLPSDPATWRELFNRTTVILLVTFLVFQLSNSSFNSLYPIFSEAKPPTGRGLRAEVVGICMSIAGIFTILFQLFLFRPLKSKLGNVGSYRGALLGLAVTMALMPFVGYKDGNPPFGLGDSKVWLYIEIGVILVIKSSCAVSGLSSAMLLITNSAPSTASLGTLNGIAQTLSAAGRSVGPFMSGGLFTASTHLPRKGEALAWGLFAGISLVGWLGCYAIHGEALESKDDGYENEEDHDDEDLS